MLETVQGRHKHSRSSAAICLCSCQGACNGACNMENHRAESLNNLADLRPAPGIPSLTYSEFIRSDLLKYAVWIVAATEFESTSCLVCVSIRIYALLSCWHVVLHRIGYVLCCVLHELYYSVTSLDSTIYIVYVGLAYRTDKKKILNVWPWILTALYVLFSMINPLWKFFVPVYNCWSSKTLV